MNYRLGPLGFPQGAEAGQKKILNLALEDQLAALEWIQENIGQFGGDKSKVLHNKYTIETYLDLNALRRLRFSEKVQELLLSEYIFRRRGLTSSHMLL